MELTGLPTNFLERPLRHGTTSRLIICDPVCALPYGHNLAAMQNFRRFLGNQYEEIICVGSSYIPDAIAEKANIDRGFGYYYHDVLPLPTGISDDDISISHAEKVTRAKADLVALLIRLKVESTDTICYPSADFYSLFALAESIGELHQCGGPKILLRLIGVMEAAASAKYARPLAVALTLINRLCASGIPVRLAAETPRYAEYLSVQLDRAVAVAPNIELFDQVALPAGDHFTVICPGSARYDKGFLYLVELFQSVRQQDPELRIRFRTQTLPDRDLRHQLSYLTKLYSIPGTTILPSQISAEEVRRMYEESDLVLLPYAHEVYAFRGSAVMIEATCIGRHCLALDGPAFIDQMRYFGTGTVCASVSDMASKIVTFSKLSPVVRFARARQARHRFLLDLGVSYRDWIS